MGRRASFKPKHHLQVDKSARSKTQTGKEYNKVNKKALGPLEHVPKKSGI